jgi:hypothetical protein
MGSWFRNPEVQTAAARYTLAGLRVVAISLVLLDNPHPYGLGILTEDERYSPEKGQSLNLNPQLRSERYQGYGQ